MFDKYNDIPFLAKWKALILDLGVKLENRKCFNAFLNIHLYKTKYAIKKPTIENFIFFDSSRDNSLIPSEVIIKKNQKKSLVKLNYRRDSPLTIKTQKSNIILELDKRKIDLEIELVPKRKYSFKHLPSNIDPERPLMENYISFLGIDRIGILFTEGCWHWNTGLACLFCDSNPKRKKERVYIPSLNTLKKFNFNENLWWQIYKKKYLKSLKYCYKYIIKNEKLIPHKHLLIMAGNTPNINKTWEILFEIIEELNLIQPIDNFDNYLCIGVPTINQFNYLLKAKKLGVKKVQFNLEVWGEKNFLKVCPGKSRLLGYQNILSCLKMAVQIFGKGNARTNFVLGAQLIEELIEGVEELAKMGIVSDYSIFVPKKGTPWEKKPSPKLDDIINFNRKLVLIYKKYNFKPIYCSLSSRTSIINEMFEY